MSAPRRGGLVRFMPPRTVTAARTPFVLLVVVLLATGLISLLLLNASVNQGAFQLSKLKKETTNLTDQEQALQQQIDQESAPGALERRARELGMVPGGNPAFLTPDGSVHGVPGTASDAPAADVPSPADASVVPAVPPPTAHPSAGPAPSAVPAAAVPVAPPVSPTAGR